MSMKKLLGCIRKADEDYHLIDENDKICVGVSGGKDSMVLLYAMSLYKNFCERIGKKHFEVIGVHIEMGFPGMDFSEADAFFASKGIQLVHYPSQIYDILKIQANENGTLKCSLCSKFKKATVICAAKEHQCTKVAFAHHADDAVETLLMNMIYGGRISTFKPAMYLTNTETHFIRPFVYAYESDISNALKEARIPLVKSTCPMDGYTKRQDAKEMLQALYRSYPMAKENFLLSLHNTEQLDLWVHAEQNEEKSQCH